MAKEKKREPVKMVSKKSSKKNPPPLPPEVDADDTSMELLDDEYQELVSEFDQIRGCIGMYISYEKTMAALHLMKEIFHNALDEFSNKKMPFHTIYLYFNEITQEFTIKDEGRGIPFSKLIKVCTKKHFSTKYERTDGMKRYTGRNGKRHNAVFKLI